jgi:hypothetical protein
MSILTIKINSVCDTSPPRPHIGPKRFKQLRWRSGSHDFYVLHLPGGFFTGYPVDFLLPCRRRVTRRRSNWSTCPLTQP